MVIRAGARLLTMLNWRTGVEPGTRCTESDLYCMEDDDDDDDEDDDDDDEEADDDDDDDDDDEGDDDDPCRRCLCCDQYNY